MGLGDELPLTVDAGVGALASDLLLLLGDAARRRGCPTGVQGTCAQIKTGGARRKKRMDRRIRSKE